MADGHGRSRGWTPAVAEFSTTPATPWRETREEFGQRLREIGRRVNEKHNVAGLCSEHPSRLQRVIEKEGDRLSS